jgi:predicted DCC family thiol-disulfide oxidoreductase YuxK
MKRWNPVAAPNVPDGLILFDGVCVLCSGWVRFVIARDHASRFRFAPIQKSYGKQLARRLGIDVAAPETNAVILNGRAYFKSDAGLRVLRELPGWRWTFALTVLPRGFRDWLYDRVARNRYRMFGRTEQCMAPTPDVLARFIVNEP